MAAIWTYWNRFESGFGQSDGLGVALYGRPRIRPKVSKRSARRRRRSDAGPSETSDKQRRSLNGHWKTRTVGWSAAGFVSHDGGCGRRRRRRGNRAEATEKKTACLGAAEAVAGPTVLRHWINERRRGAWALERWRRRASCGWRRRPPALGEGCVRQQMADADVAMVAMVEVVVTSKPPMLLTWSQGQWATSYSPTMNSWLEAKRRLGRRSAGVAFSSLAAPFVGPTRPASCGPASASQPRRRALRHDAVRPPDDARRCFSVSRRLSTGGGALWAAAAIRARSEIEHGRRRRRRNRRRRRGPERHRVSVRFIFTASTPSV